MDGTNDARYSPLDPEIFSLAWTLGRTKFEEGFNSSKYVKAAEQCLPLAMDAFRCRDLQGARNPLCLERKHQHSRCMAKFIAPSFLERLNDCEGLYEKEEKCLPYRQDLNIVVTRRMEDHVTGLEFTQDERKGIARCGVPAKTRSTEDFERRLRCLAPFFCNEKQKYLQECLKSGTMDGICRYQLENLMECVGKGASKLYFRYP